MPFCTTCGTEISHAAVFCPHCGTRQLAAPAPGRFNHFGTGFSDRTVAILCYLPMFGVIPSVLVLLSERYRSNLRLRFDAFQSLYLFLARLVVNALGPTMMFAGWAGGGPAHALVEALKLALVVAWIYLLVNAARGRQVRLPVIGDLAARSTYEQL
jgi:uncharacterized membrane protein